MIVNENAFSGIYIIRNVHNDNCYVGSAVNINVRTKRHLNALRKHKHCNIGLSNHVKLYGIDSLFFEILHKCDANELINKEQYYIDLINPTLNICKKAGSCYGNRYSADVNKKKSDALIGKRFTEERRRNMSEAKKGKPSPRKGIKLSDDTKEKLRIANLGKKASDETKRKMGAKSKGNKHNLGRKLTDEHKEKIRLKSLGNKSNTGRKLTEQHKLNIKKYHERIRQKSTEG